MFTGLIITTADDDVFRITHENTKYFQINRNKIKSIRLVFKDKIVFTITKHSKIKEWYFGFINSVDSRGKNKLFAVEAGYFTTEGEFIRFQMLAHNGSIRLVKGLSPVK